MALRQHLLNWYHSNLCHPGIIRMEKTMREHFTWPGMKNDIYNLVTKCKTCQLFKKQTKKYGKLPPKEAETKPWETVCIDQIGPYTVNTPKGPRTLRAMTMIDPATSWFEVVEIPDCSAETAALLFDCTWLSHYPRPRECHYDCGSEFIGKEFTELLDSYGIKKKKITTKNPQSNAIIERVHQVLGNMLRTFELQDQNLDDVDPWNGFLQATVFAIRSTHHTTLGATPVQLVYNRDMILDTQFTANWSQIALRKQELVYQNNKRENAKRIRWKYKVGDEVIILNTGKRKLDRPHEGPYVINKVYSNGTIDIQKGSVEYRINIRRVAPFRR